MTAEKTAPTKAGKKTPKTKAAVVNGKPKGLRPLQIKVLNLLKGGAVLSRTQMYDKLGFKNQSGLNDVLGRNDPAVRARIDAEKYPSLLGLKYIRITMVPVPDAPSGAEFAGYEITAAGKKALAAAEAK